MWRDGRHGPEIALVHRPKHDDWSLPKGKLDPGESEKEAALREVREETGLDCRLGRDLGSIRYDDGHGRLKEVRYWCMAPLDGAFAPSREIDDMRWLSLDEALGALTYDLDREVVRRAAASPGALGG